MKIAVVGGRDRKDKEFIFKILNRYINKNDTIISGGAIGVDSFAEEFAKINKIPIIVHKPKEECTLFYLERNRKIVDDCDVVLAFPSKNSRGTYYTIGYAETHYKQVIIFKPDYESTDKSD